MNKTWILWTIILCLIIYPYIFLSAIPKWTSLVVWLIFVLVSINNSIKNHKNRKIKIENQHGKNLEKINVDIHTRGMEKSGIADVAFADEQKRFNIEMEEEERNYNNKIISSFLLK